MVVTKAKNIPQLRVAVNSRCGRACFYCRPSGESLKTGADATLDADHLIAVATACAGHGMDGIKLTGGDPALWTPLVDTVRRLKTEAGLAEVQVISRHPRMGELAIGLASAGVDLVNFSVDTLVPDLHREVTGVDDLPAVLDAVKATVGSGLAVKVNMVVMAGVNDGEIDALIGFCEGAGVREIKLLDVIRDLDAGAESFAVRLGRVRGKRLRDLYVPLAPVVDRLRRRATASRIVGQGGLGHPMTALRMASGLEVVVKDHAAGAWYGTVCAGCPHFPCHDALMALRLTADLRLQFCLLRPDIAMDLAGPLAHGPEALRRTIAEALEVYGAARFEPAPSAPSGEAPCP